MLALAVAPSERMAAAAVVNRVVAYIVAVSAVDRYLMA